MGVKPDGSVKMTQNSGHPHRFEALDALRGICALLIVFFHIPVHHVLKDVPTFANLQVCVDVFFVLSGFVLYHAYGQRLTSRTDGVRFMTRRFLRLWPLHVVMLGLLALLDLAKLAYGQSDTGFAMDAQPFSQGHSAWEIVTNLAFLQSFGLHPGMSWNGPAWSAAVEFYVSILFAALILAFPRHHLPVFLILGIAAALALHTLTPTPLSASTDWGVLRAVVGVFAGGLVCAMRRPASGPLRRASLLETGFLAVLVGCAVLLPVGGLQILLLPPICGLIYVLSFDDGVVSRVFRTRWLQSLGLWSYSVYMIHCFVFQVAKTAMTFIGRKTGLDLVVWHNQEKLVQIGTPEQALLPAIILSIALVVPLAAFTYRWIERPAMTPSAWRLLKRPGRATPNAAPVAPAALA
ncbi:hypothetical protein HPGCJGGD_1780 [Methylobacterium haplocladii]|nr:hypothetical protein HPGCJGGD_1780 [Methylobacterium haplocladii]